MFVFPVYIYYRILLRENAFLKKDDTYKKYYSSENAFSRWIKGENNFTSHKNHRHYKNDTEDHRHHTNDTKTSTEIWNTKILTKGCSVISLSAYAHAPPSGTHSDTHPVSRVGVRI